MHGGGQGFDSPAVHQLVVEMTAFLLEHGLQCAKVLHNLGFRHVQVMRRRVACAAVTARLGSSLAA